MTKCKILHLCRNCIHYKRDLLWDEWHYCRRLCGPTDGINIVFCLDERRSSDAARCGTKARHFQSRGQKSKEKKS